MNVMDDKQCNLKQLKWIFKKAIFLIESCENRVLDEADFEKIIDFAQTTYEDSKKNKYCLDRMLDVLDAINREQQS